MTLQRRWGLRPSPGKGMTMLFKVRIRIKGQTVVGVIVGADSAGEAIELATVGHPNYQSIASVSLVKGEE